MVSRNKSENRHQTWLDKIYLYEKELYSTEVDKIGRKPIEPFKTVLYHDWNWKTW